MSGSAATADDEGAGGTARFRQKRDAILAAAAEAINEQSAKGMTFADVARRVGLNTTSVTYYFKRKEELAAAAFDHTLDYLLDMLATAAREADPPARVARYLQLNLERLERVRVGAERPMAVLSDLRATEEPIRGLLMARWREVFRRTRALWGQPATRAEKDLNGARAHVLLENTFLLTAQFRRYAPDQHPRVIERLMDLFTHGLAVPGARWTPALLNLDHDDRDSGRAAFFLAATRLINELGYRGASVQRIASELSVTKGSFYHHLDAKDELVTACYERSFDTIADAQREADAAGGTHWHRLSSAVATLLDVQFAQRAPLLRTTALSGLPAAVRAPMTDRSNAIARRYAGTIMDGIVEGSIRPVDALIAAQALMALQNAAFDMRKWAATMPRAVAISMYASCIFFGMFGAART